MAGVSCDAAGNNGRLNGRRDFLHVGALSALGLSLGGYLRSRSALADTKSFTHFEGKAKSVIHIWLPGGWAQQETFDPKPLAPAEYRGDMKSIDTKLPGVQFNELLGKTAQIADKITVVRSMTHGEAAHERDVTNGAQIEAATAPRRKWRRDSGMERRDVIDQNGNRSARRASREIPEERLRPEASNRRAPAADRSHCQFPRSAQRAGQQRVGGLVTAEGLCGRIVGHGPAEGRRNGAKMAHRGGPVSRRGRSRRLSTAQYSINKIAMVALGLKQPDVTVLQLHRAQRGRVGLKSFVLREN